MSLRGHKSLTATVLNTARFLVVSCGSTYLALPADGVRGILTPEERGSEPRMTLLGVTYAFIDLAGRLGIQTSSPTPEVRTILCSNGAAHRACTVDRVFGLKDVESRQLLPLPPHFAGLERVWFNGLFPFEDTAALVISWDWLLGDHVLASAMPSVAETHTDRRELVSDSAEMILSGQSVTAPSLAAIELEEASDAEDTPWAPI